MRQKIMIPYPLKGRIKTIREGEFTVDETVAVLETQTGEVLLTMVQKWPVRQGRPYRKKACSHPSTGDGAKSHRYLFSPIAKGGVAAVPGPFGQRERP